MIYIFLFGILFSFIIGLAVWAIIEAIIHNKMKKIMKNKIIVGNCMNTRWGCCPDNLIPKYDQMGTNCTPFIKQNLNTEEIVEKTLQKSNLSLSS